MVSLELFTYHSEFAAQVTIAVPHRAPHRAVGAGAREPNAHVPAAVILLVGGRDTIDAIVLSVGTKSKSPLLKMFTTGQSHPVPIIHTDIDLCSVTSIPDTRKDMAASILAANDSTNQAFQIIF